MNLQRNATDPGNWYSFHIIGHCDHIFGKFGTKASSSEGKTLGSPGRARAELLGVPVENICYLLND